MIRFKQTLFLFSWLVIGSSPGLAQPPKMVQREPVACGLDGRLLDQIDGLVEKAIQQKKMPGAVVLIGRRGAIAFHRAYGHRQLQPDALPMQNDTLFDLASITKPVATATSIMQLIERGVIRLRDKVSDHIPEFAEKGKENVTIQQLLTHVAGLIPDNPIKDYEGTPEQSIQNFLKIDLNYEPDKDFRYSDVGFLVLGELIQRKTGKNVHQYSQENIFGPLGMRETTYVPGPELVQRAATTEKRGDGWMVGQVHDPRAYALGGIAGHAGLFGTATDLAVYAQMMLEEGTYRGVRILGPRTVRLMTDAYEVPKGLRGLGWDKRTGYSTNRGETMSPRAFGHGGFTGTGLWIDPELDLFVVFLSNRVHPDGKGLVNPLIGTIGTLAASAIVTDVPKEETASGHARTGKVAHETADVLCGIDVLVQRDFEPLSGRRVGIITNHTGLDRQGVSLGKRLLDSGKCELVALFSPEHGFAGRLDQEKVSDSVDPETKRPVYSLYGANRKPTPQSLQGIDTLVFDIQDIGARFYTYVSTMGGAMEVAAQQGIRFVVLDRPNPINGRDVAGPMLDAGMESFVAYHSLPVRHGMTVCELAMMLKTEKSWNLDLQIFRCQNWNRADMLDASGLRWINPSPNMRNLNQALLYPGIGLLEYSNLSVGRGTDTPFEHIGAPWIDEGPLAKDLNALGVPGIRFMPQSFTPDSSKFQNQACQGVRILIIDRAKVQPVALGLAIASSLRRLYPDVWEYQSMSKLLGSTSVLEAVKRQSSWQELQRLADQGVPDFLRRRSQYLLYP